MAVRNSPSKPQRRPYADAANRSIVVGSRSTFADAVALQRQLFGRLPAPSVALQTHEGLQ
jgi:hypothetical protein